MATNIKKAIKAGQADWSIVADGAGAWIFYREEVGEGYPHAIHVLVDDDECIINGTLYSDYGRGEGTEEFEVGSRSIIYVLENVNNPFRFKTFYDAYMALDPVSVSERGMGDAVGESERQIRNARILGSMSGYLADRLCVVLLKRLAVELYGFDAWVEHESKGAWPEPPKKRGKANA